MSTDNQMEQPNQPLSAEQQILLLFQILHKLREEENVDVLITTTITYLQQQFDYPLIWIAVYNQANKTLYGKGGITPDGDTSYLQRSVVLNPGNLLEPAVTELRPVGIPNLQEQVRASEWQELAIKYNIQGTIILPIHYKNRCLGLVLIGSQRWGYLLSGEARARLLIVVGELGIILNQKEKAWQQQETPSTSEELLKLLENLRSLNDFNKKLETAVDATHKFVSPTRTNIYWYERERHYFWCRMSSQLVSMGRNLSNQPPTAGITVQELGDVYFNLAVNEVVCISESSGSINNNLQGKLLQSLGVRSLLAAPIILHKDLVGFLAVESTEPQVWTQADKHFIQGAAGLISLVAPTDSMESTIGQIQQDNQLIKQITQAIYKDQDLPEILYPCAKIIIERLAATQFLLLQYQPNQNIYQVFYQSAIKHRRAWRLSLTALPEIDFQMLQNATQALEIENLDADLPLFTWRSQLLENGVRSLLICNCIQGHTPQILLVITHETHRSWTTQEKELLWFFSQQIGVIVRNWQLRIITQEQEKISQIFKQYPSILIEAESGTIEKKALKHIATVLQCPLAVILSWSPSQEWATIIPGVMTNNHFGIVENIPISIERDVLIELAVAHNSYVIFKAYDLPPATRQWLTVPDRGQVWVMALRSTADSQPIGIVLLADYAEQAWSDINLSVTATLVSQLAWWQSQQQIIQALESNSEGLRELNWYKHRRLEEVRRMLNQTLTKIHDLGIPANELTQMRYKLLLRQLDYITNSMTGVIKQEQWQLHMSWETMSISSLLKRAIERVDTLVKQQQMWIGVHGLAQPTEPVTASKSSSLSGELLTASNPSPLATSGDIVKIEFIVHELLLAACKRSPIGERIDIWYNQLDERSLELLITDHGIIDPYLLAELSQNGHKNVLASANLNQPPGLHLLICKHLIQQMGGELQIYQSPDHRVVSRLVLPLAPSNSEGNTIGNTSSLTQ
ncbi:GAF domain-containing protein [Trichormus sp. NMC-1]|uniref:sensor histidine kinase n=1 Tax=Trichormus sp. NMC-1 TaxID=1853259 RepID=UPI000AEE955C|nr:GAF domain-containing protein [Trichormus sp. NMC-1]